MRLRPFASRAALLKYSRGLAPGVTRKEIEEYLRTRHTSFNRRCCIESHDTFSDLVIVAEEEAPWYCSAWPIYVAFVFALPPGRAEGGGQETRVRTLGSFPSQEQSGVLQKVELTSNGEVCL
jgi:hypothetical protein